MPELLLPQKPEKQYTFAIFGDLIFLNYLRFLFHLKICFPIMT